MFRIGTKRSLRLKFELVEQVLIDSFKCWVTDLYPGGNLINNVIINSENVFAYPVKQLMSSQHQNNTNPKQQQKKKPKSF